MDLKELARCTDPSVRIVVFNPSEEVVLDSKAGEIYEEIDKYKSMRDLGSYFVFIKDVVVITQGKGYIKAKISIPIHELENWREKYEEDCLLDAYRKYKDRFKKLLEEIEKEYEVKVNENC